MESLLDRGLALHDCVEKRERNGEALSRAPEFVVFLQVRDETEYEAWAEAAPVVVQADRVEGGTLLVPEIGEVGLEEVVGPSVDVENDEDAPALNPGPGGGGAVAHERRRAARGAFQCALLETFIQYIKGPDSWLMSCTDHGRRIP